MGEGSQAGRITPGIHIVIVIDQNPRSGKQEGFDLLQDGLVKADIFVIDGQPGAAAWPTSEAPGILGIIQQADVTQNIPTVIRQPKIGTQRESYSALSGDIGCKTYRRKEVVSPPAQMECRSRGGNGKTRRPCGAGRGRQNGKVNPLSARDFRARPKGKERSD